MLVLCVHGSVFSPALNKRMRVSAVDTTRTTGTSDIMSITDISINMFIIFFIEIRYD